MMRTIILQGQPYIVGLRWSPTEGLSKSAIIAEAIASQKYDRLILLDDQYGLADCGGKKGDVRALAAVIRFKEEGDLIRICMLRDEFSHQPFWWVIGLSHGMISARSDKLFDTLEEAKDFAQSLQHTLGIDDIEELTEEANTARLTNLLATLSRSERKALRLLPLHQDSHIKLLKIGGILSLIFSVCWSGSYFMEYRQQQERAEKNRLAMMQKEERIRELQSHPDRHFPRQWMKDSAPDDVLRNGIAAMLSVPLAANGWKLDSLNCSDKAMTARWEQTPFADYLHLPFAGTLDERHPQFSSSRHTMKPVPAHEGRTVESLLSQQEATRQLYAFTRKYALKLRLAFAKRAEKKVEKQTITCPWVTATWELSGISAALIADHDALANELNIPGLILKEISYSDNAWKLKGTLYAR